MPLQRERIYCGKSRLVSVCVWKVKLNILAGGLGWMWVGVEEVKAPANVFGGKLIKIHQVCPGISFLREFF